MTTTTKLITIITITTHIPTTADCTLTPCVVKNDVTAVELAAACTFVVLKEALCVRGGVTVTFTLKVGSNNN